MRTSIFSNFFHLFSAEPQEQNDHEVAQIGGQWSWLLMGGIAYIILGLFTLSMPIATTFGVVYMIGGLLIAVGVIQFVHLFTMPPNKRERLGRFLQSAFSLIAGGLMIRYPQGGMLTVALVLSFYFLVGSVIQWMLAMSLRPQKAWGWVLFSSLCSFALGVFMIVTFPFSAFWLPGLLLAIDLLISGTAMIGFAIAARSVHKRSAPPLETTRKIPHSADGRPRHAWQH